MMPETISSALRLYHMCQQTKHGASQIKRNRTPGWWCYYEVHRTSLTTAWGPPYYYTICRDTDRFSFFVVAPSPCCDVVVAVSLSILQDVSIQSQDSRSISDSTPYGSPRNSPKVFLFRMITLFNARRGIPERGENFKKRESESARDTSTLVCRSAAQLDRTGPATRPIQ